MRQCYVYIPMNHFNSYTILDNDPCLKSKSITLSNPLSDAIPLSIHARDRYPEFSYEMI
jgi:hypothetical protein